MGESGKCKHKTKEKLFVLKLSTNVEGPTNCKAAMLITRQCQNEKKIISFEIALIPMF